MQKTPIKLTPAEYPEAFGELLRGASLYDSSCSPAARVIFIDRDGGYYLKSAAAGTLRREADMTRWFGEKKLGAEVLDYRTEDGQDWLLTTRVPGEDCVFADYLADPARLCDTLAECMRMLHGMPYDTCPVQNRTAEWFASAEEGYRAKKFDPSYYADDYGSITPDGAWKTVSEGVPSLTDRVLLHGDFCLPNIMLADGRFSGFIDVGNGGVGDRHIDLYWVLWSLRYNLKTDAYRARFLDAYGRDAVEEEKFRTVAAAETFG